MTTKATTPEQIFDAAYERLARKGHCDSPGGGEYERVKEEWLAAKPMSAAVTEIFIREHANCPPDKIPNPEHRFAFTAVIHDGYCILALAERDQPGYEPRPEYGRFDNVKIAEEHAWILNQDLGLSVVVAFQIIRSAEAAQRKFEAEEQSQMESARSIPARVLEQAVMLRWALRRVRLPFGPMTSYALAERVADELAEYHGYTHEGPRAEFSAAILGYLTRSPHREEPWIEGGEDDLDAAGGVS